MAKSNLCDEVIGLSEGYLNGLLTEREYRTKLLLRLSADADWTVEETNEVANLIVDGV